MPKVASIAVLPVHVAPAAKGNEGASRRQDHASPEFGKMLREQAGPIQPLIGTKMPSGAEKRIDSDAPAEAQDLCLTECLTADSTQSLPKDSGSDTGIRGKETTVATLPPRISDRLLPGERDKLTPAIEIADLDSSAQSQTLSGRKEETKEIPAGDSQAPGKEKKIVADGERKSEAVALFPAAGPMALSILSPSLPILTASEPAVGKDRSIDQTANPRSTQDSGGSAARLTASGLGQSVALSPDPPSGGGSVAQAAPSGAEFGLAVPSENGKEQALNSAEKSDLSKPAARVPSQVSRADLERTLNGAGIAGAPLGTVTAHASTDAPVSGEQAKRFSPSVVASVSGPTVAGQAPGTPNPYDRIDQGAAPVVLHSGMQHVSVGVHDPDLGWVEIQTQSAAGHVDATLVTASGQAHASLVAQLPAISQYLEQRDVKLGALIAHHHAIGGGSSGTGGGSGHGSANSGAGAHQSGPGNSGSHRPASHSGGALLQPVRSGPWVEPRVQGFDEDSGFRAVSYINVHA